MLYASLKENTERNIIIKYVLSQEDQEEISIT